MRRVDNLWSRVLERDNLLMAFWKAARGKRGTLEVRRFAASLDPNLEALREAVESGLFELGHHHVFKVYEPKERTIHAARFVERVFHHAFWRCANLCLSVKRFSIVMPAGWARGAFGRSRLRSARPGGLSGI